jgi:exopolyphosphatase/guanosine-5'-triphosphate,3'-diphosphate pyrophosphatase
MKKLWASIDLGTNSCLLLLCEKDDHGRLREVHEQSEIVRLGEGLGDTGHLSEAAIRRTLAALDHHLDCIPRDTTSGVGVAAATSAVRDATNGSDFLKLVSERLGGTPCLFNGEEEALTTFLGAASELRHGQFAVTVDVGGGSTEIAAGTRDDCRLTTSLDLGCVRCGEKFGLLDVATPEAIHALRCHVRKTVAPLRSRIKELSRGRSVHALASAGTATTLAAYKLEMETYDRKQIHGRQSDCDEIDNAIANLAFLSAEERAKIPGIRPGRAAVLPAGLIILGETLKALGLDEFTVTTRALRYGMVLRLQDGELTPTFRW